ncbi:Hypothetical_protein [Hexamita inflata]|uniref:Hypothetical_protein n=1 Tax=Hexamita inflata TaxID=28002 RepID=A0AA86PY46_9EUKA|nr:Hypothetical protein HINF_LOCUS5742 [Hexamita inflata]CAI9943112.1 Hypothetical protein HINF_LOCUS30757 [Hexamita inflata]
MNNFTKNPKLLSAPNSCGFSYNYIQFSYLKCKFWSVMHNLNKILLYYWRPRQNKFIQSISTRLLISVPTRLLCLFKVKCKQSVDSILRTKAQHFPVLLGESIGFAGSLEIITTVITKLKNIWLQSNFDLKFTENLN